MMYLLTSVVLVSVFLVLRKFEEKQSFLRSLICTIVAYECYLCVIAGIMTVIHIPVDIYSVSVVNIISIIGILILLFKKKNFQSYSLDIGDTVFIILLAALVIFIFLRRFTGEWNIVFETSDPGVHLQLAMNFVNNKAVEGMYIGQLMNGLLIESLMDIFSGEMVYKSFLIQCGINLFVTGAVFWTVLQKFEKNLIMRIVVYGATAAYLLGYPYNDFLFGFVYLQMAITVICYIISLMQDFLQPEANIWFLGVMIGAGCLGVSIGYTLFAPPVYISVFVLIAYKAYQEKWVKVREGFLLTKRFILCNLNVFLLPTFLTICLIIIVPKINGSFADYGGALSTAEGYIYRNLYSDFLLYSMAAIYGLYVSFKKKKVNLLAVLCAVFGIYYFGFLFLMLTDHISTYYFYKLNYLLWMLIIGLFVIGIEEIWNKEKALFTVILSGMLFLAVIYITKFEPKYQEKNANYLPYADASTFFRIYDCNRRFEQKRTSMPEELIQISGKVLGMETEEPVVFIGYWKDLYWYEALTNQRFKGLAFISYMDVMEAFKSGEYGNYAVVTKGCESIEVYQQYIMDNAVYENEYAYLIQR